MLVGSILVLGSVVLVAMVYESRLVLFRGRCISTVALLGTNVLGCLSILRIRIGSFWL